MIQKYPIIGKYNTYKIKIEEFNDRGICRYEVRLYLNEENIYNRIIDYSDYQRNYKQITINIVREYESELEGYSNEEFELWDGKVYR